MGAEGKNRSEILSGIAADLFVKSKGGEELSSTIDRLRDEIRNVIESEDTIFGKIRELLDSFRDIIPEEKQRYTAAIKALSTTSKLSRQEIVKAVKTQLEELKILEKGFLSAVPGWSDEFKAMETKSQEMRDEIAKLREKLERLEREEKGILAELTAKKKDMDLVEKAVGKLFADIGAEINRIKDKVEESGVAVSRPAPRAAFVPSDIPNEEEEEKAEAEEEEEEGDDERTEETPEPPAPQDTRWQKKCPMCGGRMNFHSKDDVWLCYSCAYEESAKDAGALETISDPFPSLAAPAKSGSSHEHKSKKGSSSSHSQPSKKKACPSCRKTMYWYAEEKAWRCSSCDYERRI